MNYDRYRNWRYIASYSALNYLQAGAMMLLTLLLANFLSVETFAEYRVGITVFSIVSVAGLYGAEKGLLIDLVHRGKEGLTISAYWIVRLVVAVAAAIVVALYMLRSGAVGISILFGFVGILAALRSPGWFDYRVRLREHTAILLSDRVILAALAIFAILVANLNLGAFELGAMTLAATALTLTIELAIISRYVEFSSLSFDLISTETKSIFLRHSWVWFLALSNMLMTSLGQLVLFSRGGPAELAYLGIALQFATVSRLFMQQVVRLQGPAIAMETIADLTPSRLAGLMGKSVSRAVVGGVVLSLVIGGVATWVLQEMFDQKYISAIPIVWVLSIWIIVLGIGLNVNRYVIGLGLQKPAFIAGLFWGAASILTTYLVSPEYGAIGYALTLLSCHAGAVASQVFILFRRI